MMLRFDGLSDGARSWIKEGGGDGFKGRSGMSSSRVKFCI